MRENISVEAGKCCTQFAERHIPKRHLPCPPLSPGEDFLCTEHSDVKHKAESVSHLAATTGEVEQVLL